MYRRRKRGELRGSSKPSRGSCNYGRGMKAKLKIEETQTGYRCRVCGRRFRTEEAAFVHQSYDCSQGVRTLVEE